MKCKECKGHMTFHYMDYNEQYDYIIARFDCEQCHRTVEQDYEQVEAKGLDYL